MFFSCWKSSSVAVAPAPGASSSSPHTARGPSSRSSERYISRSPQTPTEIARPVVTYAWGVSQSSSSSSSASSSAVRTVTPQTHAIGTATLAISQESLSSRRPIVATSVNDLSTRQSALPPNVGLAEGIVFLIGSFFSCQERAQRKSINCLWKKDLDRQNMPSFQQITRYVEEMHSFYMAPAWAKKGTHFLNSGGFWEHFNIKSLIEHLIKNVKPDSTAIQKINWLFWKFRTRIIYSSNVVIEKISHEMSSKGIVSADLTQYLPSQSYYFTSPVVKPEEINWDSIDVRIVMDYYQHYNYDRGCNTYGPGEKLSGKPLKKYIVEQLVRCLVIESSIQMKRGNKEFFWNLSDSINTDLGREIYRQVFSELEKSEGISNEELFYFFSSLQSELTLFCKNRRYIDQELLFIKNCCPHLTQVTLHDPSFSSDTIKKFLEHPSSINIEDFKVLSGTIDLNAIASFLKSDRKTILRISILKIKASDLFILQKINVGNLNMVCNQIVVEDTEASKEKMDKLVNCLVKSNFLSKSKRFDFSNTKLTPQALQLVMEEEEIAELKFENCSEIDRDQLEEFTCAPYFWLHREKCILLSAFPEIQADVSGFEIIRAKDIQLPTKDKMAIQAIPERIQTISTVVSSTSRLPNFAIKVQDRKTVRPSLLDLPLSIFLLVRSHLFLHDCARMSGVSRALKHLQDNDTIACESHIGSVHQIDYLVAEMNVMFRQFTVGKKRTYKILKKSVEILKIRPYMQHLIEKCTINPVYQSKLHWLFWDLSKRF